VPDDRQRLRYATRDLWPPWLDPALLPAHEEAIRVAARSPRRADTTKDHSPGLVVFVSQELGEPLPQPEYLEVLKNAAPIPEEIPSDEEFREGAAVQVLVNRYESDPAARQVCIKHYGTTCIACGVSLAQLYGPEAEGLIHVHHLTPLANLGAQSIVDPVRDLRPVCPNCHAVIHLTDPPRAIEAVRAMLCEHGSAHKKA
jgi:5-methylcytosine-specific restriction enzyme A